MGGSFRPRISQQDAAAYPLQVYTYSPVPLIGGVCGRTNSAITRPPVTTVVTSCYKLRDVSNILQYTIPQGHVYTTNNVIRPGSRGSISTSINSGPPDSPFPKL